MLIAILTLALVGCGNTGYTQDEVDALVSDAVEKAVSDQSDLTLVPTAASSTTITRPTTTTSQPEPGPVEVTAENILLGLAAQGSPISDYVAYTASTDPNELLGRPGGYTSKVNFTDVGIESRSTNDPFDLSNGGSIEVYATESGATNRALYIRNLIDSVGFLGNEYHIQRGGVLLRLSQALTPEAVSGYEQLLDAALEDLNTGVQPPPLKTLDASDPGAAAKPMPPDSSPFVAGTFDGDLPTGEEGTVSVIAQAITDGSSIPIIVRNMTPDSIVRVEVAGVARDKTGTLLASGSSQGLKPNLISPGEIAFGYVYFGLDLSPSNIIDYTLTFESSSGDFAQYENIRNLTPVEWARSGGNVVTILTNNSESPLRGPFSIYLACFSATGSLSDVTSSFSDNDSAEVGAAVSSQIRAGIPCDTFLVAGSGFTN